MQGQPAIKNSIHHTVLRSIVTKVAVLFHSTAKLCVRNTKYSYQSKEKPSVILDLVIQFIFRGALPEIQERHS